MGKEASAPLHFLFCSLKNLMIFLSEQKTITLDLNSKGIRLDVYISDDENSIFAVEMQKSDRHNLPKRTRYKRMEVEFMTLLERDRINREEGRSEGIEQKALEAALNLKAKGVSDEIIAEAVGLPIERVRAL